MRLTGPVLAATALDAAGDEAIRQAAEHAATAGVALVVCHVLPEIYGSRPLFPHLREADREAAEQVRRTVAAALDTQVRRVLDDPARAADLRVEAGSPHSGVLHLADQIGAGLIVIGSGSHEQGVSWGEVGERILRHASSPVLVARPRVGSAVLAATDFSDPAMPAIEWGGAEARGRGQRFVVIHSVEIRMLPVDSPYSHPTLVISQLIDAENERAKLALEEVATLHQADEARLRHGPPADAILEEAKRLSAGLIVVGCHGQSGLRRLTLGSVAESVVRRAPCSVLVVRLAQ